MRRTVLFGMLMAVTFGVLPVQGQSVFTVDRLTDAGEGEGSTGDLRYCITNAVDGDTITFDVVGTINLTRALPDLIRSLNIEGPGANFLTVRRNTSARYRIFTVTSATIISGLTIAGGHHGDRGAGISNSGILTVSNCIITNNLTDAFIEGGGGIHNVGTLTIDNTTISGNSVLPPVAGIAFHAPGGGISNRGTLFISNSTITGNLVRGQDDSKFPRLGQGRGGGIDNFGTLTIDNTTISGNYALGESIGVGGGIYNGGTLTINSTTISGNNAVDSVDQGFGGGIFRECCSVVLMRNTILAGNTVNFRGSGPDLYGVVGSLGHNLIGDTRDGSGFDKTDLLNVNPMLGNLQDNGGPTFTHALLFDSPAIDAGDNTDPPDFDQRGEGFPRIVNGIIDIGAFEFQKAGPR